LSTIADSTREHLDALTRRYTRHPRFYGYEPKVSPGLSR
jgi:hypothetical protein